MVSRYATGINEERWFKGRNKDINPDTTNVLDNIKSEQIEIRTQHELASRILYGCLTSCLDPASNATQHLQFLDLYNAEISVIADEEVRQFRQFSENILKLGSKDAPKAQSWHEKLMESVGILREIQLLEQIKDIQDELHTLKVLIGHQKTVIDQLYDLDPALGSSASSTADLTDKPASAPRAEIAARSESALKAHRAVREYESQVEDMSKHAEHTYEALLRLIDLKQKYANVQEARVMREQSVETSRVGNILFGFTVLSAFFLPLSFLSSFFAIPIAAFLWIDVADGRLSLSWVSMYMFPTSLAFSAVTMWLIVKFDFILRVKEKLFKKGRTPSKDNGNPAEESRSTSATVVGIEGQEPLQTNESTSTAVEEAPVSRSRWTYRGPFKTPNEEEGTAGFAPRPHGHGT
ncbi:hypothetical protein E8E13_008383 [Curvularia kusanoi]|uniref:Uncharacterized protein n=1 Tax=Curvularia kusanoi TaxID=90978 RepID=A0A9P4TK63_CURKU|nr:hypothetical protein E8E13_008383 [Curvularia kusanoi]